MDFEKVESSVLGTNSPLQMCVYFLIKRQNLCANKFLHITECFALNQECN